MLSRFVLSNALPDKSFNGGIGGIAQSSTYQTRGPLVFKNPDTDAAKLNKLFATVCIPKVGKVATFGHQYAFARAPTWFRESSGTTFKSEPMWMKKIVSKEGTSKSEARQPSEAAKDATPPAV
eukprot:gene13220-19058_t